MSVVCTAPTDATDLLAEVQSGDLGGLPAAPEQSGQVPGPAEPEEAQGQPHQHGLLQAHGQVGLRRVQKGRVLRNTSQEDSDSLIENAHVSVAICSRQYILYKQYIQIQLSKGQWENKAAI